MTFLFQGFDLYGKVVGVLGTGAIGAVFARIMKLGFQCEVLACDVVVNNEHIIAVIGESDGSYCLSL